MEIIVYVAIVATVLAMIWGAYSKKADQIRTAYMDQVKYFPSHITLEDGETVEDSLYGVNLQVGKKESKPNMLVDLQTWLANNREVNDYYMRTS
jgi:hypothetical protein